MPAMSPATTAERIISRSATGSRALPSLLTCPRRLARYPSTQSVVAITAKRTVAAATLSAPRRSHQKTGIAASLVNETRLGMVTIRSETRSSVTRRE